MSDITAAELTPESPIPFDYPDGLEAAAEYAFNHVEKDPETGKVFMSGFEVDLGNKESLKQMMLAYVMNIYWQ